MFDYLAKKLARRLRLSAWCGLFERQLYQWFRSFVRSGGRARVWRVATLRAVGVLGAVCLAPLAASTAGLAADPEVMAARKVLLEAATEIPFPIHIKNRDQLPKNSFLRIRGDLSGLKLSQGHRVSASAWAIPIGKLSELTIRLEAGLNEPRQLRVLLVALDGSSFRSFAMSDVTLYGNVQQLAADQRPKTREQTLAVMRATSNLPVGAERKEKSQTERIAPPPGSAPGNPKFAARTPVSPPAAPVAPSAPAPRPALSPENQKRAAAMLQRGRGVLANGDVVAARLFFERAARIGFGAAALAMAETFDPEELRRLGVLGIRPDVDEARKWYEKAKALGEGEADRRLRRLSANY